MARKISIWFTDASLEIFERAFPLIQKNRGTADYSKVVNEALRIFSDLFLDDEQTDIDQRLMSLKKLETIDARELVEKDKIILYKQEVSMYILLAIYNLVCSNNEQNVESIVTSISSTAPDYFSSNQSKLLNEIAKVINEDHDRNKILKEDRKGKRK